MPVGAANRGSVKVEATTALLQMMVPLHPPQIHAEFDRSDPKFALVRTLDVIEVVESSGTSPATRFSSAGACSSRSTVPTRAGHDGTAPDIPQPLVPRSDHQSDSDARTATTLGRTSYCTSEEFVLPRGSEQPCVAAVVMKDGIALLERPG